MGQWPFGFDEPCWSAECHAFAHPPKITYFAAMSTHNPDPLHGKTLQVILEHLVDYYGWEMLGIKIPINCFLNDPSISSSLRFLRKYDWARKQVEELYVDVIRRG